MLKMFEQRYINRITLMKMYWFILILIGVFLVQFVILSNSRFVCNSKKCEIIEQAFFNLIKNNRDINIYEIEKFKLHYKTGMFPSYGSDGNFYYITAYMKNGESKVFMESYHTNKENAEKIEKQLNTILQDKLNIDVDIKF